MSLSILEEAASLLPDLYGTEWQSLQVRGLWLQELYTVVELSNGQVGVALNYDNEGFLQYRRQYDPTATADDLLASVKQDHLLINTLLRRQTLTLCERSVLCATLSALTQPFLEPVNISRWGYELTDGDISLDSISRPGDIIHIVGFGGYLEQALASPKFVQVYVSDLKYSLPEGRAMIERELEHYRQTMRAHSVFVYDGTDYADYLQNSDIVVITGSALCNGSMETLLETARNAREVIIYGHSGTLLPSIYFQRGVSRLCWSVIPPYFLERFKARLACQDTTSTFPDFIDQVLEHSFTIHSPLAQKIIMPVPGLTINKETSDSDRSTTSNPPDTSRDYSTDSNDMNAGSLFDIAQECHRQGRLDWANYHYSSVLENAAVSGDLRAAAECAYRLGLLLLDESNEHDGRKWLEHSLELWHALNEVEREEEMLKRLGRNVSGRTETSQRPGQDEDGRQEDKQRQPILVSYDYSVLAQNSQEEQVFETDWLASEPVFYNELTGKVSHLIDDVIDYDRFEFDPEGFNDYLDFGFSVFGQTPIKHVKFLRHSSRLVIKPNGSIQVEHLDDPVKKRLGKTSLESEVLERLSFLIEQCEKATEGSIVVSLSGGYDGRLLLSQFSDRSRIRAFTYGVSQNQEISRGVVYARKLAETLGFQWEWIPLNAFHRYFNTWDRLYGLSTHAHAHGMHYIEFTHEIRQRIKEAGLFLTGVFGDYWAGRIQFPPIESAGQITLLGYTHGMNADSRQSLFATDYPLRMRYWEENSNYLADDRFRAIEVARTRAMLLSYFNRAPRLYGFEPYSPFVDLELAMKMITLPPERRQKRTWQREFFEKNGLDLENMGLVADTKFSLDIQAIRSRPLRPLDRSVLREVVRGEYVDWINQNLADISARTAVSGKALAAYYAYLVLLPVENLIRKRDAHYYGQQQDSDQEALLCANQKRVFPKAHLLDESIVQPIETFRKGVESYALYLKPTGELYDPVFGEPTQYGTAYYALCNAMLAASTEGDERRKYSIRARNGLEAALEHVSDLSRPPTASGFKRDSGEVYRANHRDFFWPAILKTYRLLTRLQAPGMRRFAGQIADVEIKRAFSDRPPSNVAAVWLAGEWLRLCERLSPYTMDQIDEWVSSFFAERIVIDKGLYLEPGYPNSYDLFTRYHLAELLLEGYHGKWENALEQLFVNGARRSLAFQLSDGSLASAHRSTGQTWTLGIQCAFFTHVANYFQERDADLASRAMQAAQRAYQAMQRWQRCDGPYSPVENCLPPGYRIGYEFYTADGHYGPLALSFLGIAIHNGFRLTQSDAVDPAPSVYIEHGPTYRAIVHSGRYSVHVNANPTLEYDGLGIVDLTFGSGRYFHFVSSAKHIETGRIFNLGMACRSNPIERAELIIMAQQPSMLIGSIEEGEVPASLRMVTRLRNWPYAYMIAVTIDDQDGVYITESTPGVRNYKTLLIPYVRDLGIGLTTEVRIREGAINLLFGQEEIGITLNQETDKIIHLPYGFENRRGLCGLVRVDFREPCEGISYWVKVIR